jgi:CO/xanthine dehydrogenase Mo-binding subunit
LNVSATRTSVKDRHHWARLSSEAAQGPTAAAIANALADAAGVRLRGVPLTAQRVKAAIGI